MDKIRTIIIDDEAPAREIIKKIPGGFDYIDVAAECADGFQD